MTALQEKQTQGTPPSAREAGRQKPVTALDAMRAANRVKADRQREAQRAAGLTVTARQAPVVTRRHGPTTCTPGMMAAKGRKRVGFRKSRAIPNQGLNPWRV